MREKKNKSEENDKKNIKVVRMNNVLKKSGMLSKKFIILCLGLLLRANLSHCITFPPIAFHDCIGGGLTMIKLESILRQKSILQQKNVILGVTIIFLDMQDFL